MGGEPGGLGGEAPRFRPRRTRGVRGAEPPGLQVHGVQQGVRGLAPRFRPRRTRGGPGGLPPGLGHGIQGWGPGGLPPGLGHSAWN